MDIIIIIFIIYVIYKKYNNSSMKITSILQNKGFSNISTIRQNASSYWMSANFHGDNYLFEVMRPGCNVSNFSIHSLGEFATKSHYHNIILIPGNSAISSKARPVLSQYNIQIWDNNKLNGFSTQSREKVASSVIKTSEIHDTCKIDTPDDPIQDGTKANSVWRNFFGNKVEKL